MSENTPTFPAPLAGDTQRAFLVRHGLAKEGRGRFSTDAKNVLALFPDFQWADAKPAPSGKATRATVPAATGTPVGLATAPTTAPSAPAHPAGATASFDAKAVRAWAKQNGHEVGERGRIHASVIAAYAKAGGKPVGQGAKRVTPMDMPKRRPHNKGFVQTPQGRVVQDVCGSRSCGQSVSRCACPGGPVSFPIDGQVYPLVYDL